MNLLEKTPRKTKFHVPYYRLNMRAIILFFLIFIGKYGNSQSLSVGDIAIIGMNCDPSTSLSKNFAIVCLADLSEGQIIKFSDKAYYSNAFSTLLLNGSEGIFSWTIPVGGVGKGTVIMFTITSGATPSVTTTPSLGSTSVIEGWTSTAPLTSPFGQNGDAILIYQGLESSPTFIFGFNCGNSISGLTNGWNTGLTLNPNGACELPGTLTSGSNAVGFGGAAHVNNFKYNGIQTGSKLALLSAISNTSSWISDDITEYNLTPGSGVFSGTQPIFTITSPNTAPTDLNLSSSSINENVALNSTVGSLSSTDVDAGNTFTYTLVSGTGSTDNALFNISGNNLRITNSPDFETASSYSVRIRTTDQGGLTFEKAFTISINNLNEPPTDLNLSNSSINENVASNSTVGSLSSTDVDAGNTFTYTLVSGTGSTDNVLFNINGNNLRITNSPDFETASSYSVRIRTTDQGGLTFEKAFTISINNENEMPNITSQPVGESKCAGSDLILSVTATNSINYQWQESADGILFTAISDGGIYNGSNTNTLTLSGVSIDINNHEFRCVLTNSDGSLNSDEVLLSVFDCTQLSTSSCGATVTNGTTFIYADAVPNATMYKFELNDGTTNTEYESITNSFSFAQLGTFFNNQDFSVRIATKVNDIYSLYGPSCNLRIERTAKIRDLECGITVTKSNMAIWSSPVFNANAYKFEFTDPNNNITTYESTTRNFKFSDFASVNNTTYSVRVSVKTGSFYSMYGEPCNVRYEMITKIQASQCGATITNKTTTVSASAVAGATAYKFEITDPSNTVIYIENASRSFTFSQFAFVNNTTYTVRVSAKTGSTYSTYGVACDVRIEQTVKIQSSQCGAQIALPSSSVWTGSMTGATGYRFELTDPNNVVTILDNPTRNFKFNQFAFTPGAVYSVRVSVKTGSYYAMYGTACNVTAPSSNNNLSMESPVEVKSKEMDEKSFEMNVFPNPSNGNFTISSSEIGKFNIINELGQMIRTIEITEANTNQVKVENMPNGVYFVTGILKGNVVTRKVIVVR